MSKAFTTRPANVSQRGRGRGRTQTGSQEAALVGTSLSPTRAAAPNRSTSGTAARNRGGGAVSRGRGNGQTTNPSVKGAAGGKDSTSSRSTLQERTTYAGGFTVIRPDEKRRREVAQQAEKESRQYEQFRKQNKPTSFSYVGTAGGGEGASLAEARQQQIRTQAQHSKASRLTTLSMQKQKDKQGNWKSEMNRVNQAFLDRLEAQSKSDKAPSEQT